MSIGIADIAVYLPRARLERSAIAAAHAWAVPGLKGRGKGQIAAANWDEDSVTLAHAAVRQLSGDVASLQFCSTSMPFADRSHASLLVEALQLKPATASQDSGASARAGTSALLAALRSGQRDAVVVAAEKRLAKPASEQEIGQGDAGVAVHCGAPVLAEFIDGETLATDFVDHYRSADSDFDYSFEARWVRDEGYLADLPAMIPQLLSRNDLEAGDVARFVINAPARVRGGIARRAGLSNAAIDSSVDAQVGDAGCAAPLLMLAEALGRSADGDLLIVGGFGQGADLMLLRATARRPTAFADALAAGAADNNYLRYLSHRGLLQMDWGKRAERDVRTAQSAYYRARDQVSGFVGGRCTSCGTVQYPRTRACVNPDCRAFDTQVPHPFADLTGTVKSFTEDWQAYSPAPPLVYGNITFEGGANIFMQFTDTASGEVTVGDSVSMQFRIKDIDRSRGFQRYFWKAVPVREH
ncbi:MAG: zinc ribbon domain-containing protein [Pseudomonadota bacterium]